MKKLPNSHACFVCGDRNPNGLAVRFLTDGEKVWTRFTPRAPQMGYNGITHGGVLASLLDETMGWAPALIKRRFCMAVELNVEYRKSVPVDTEIIVSARVTSSHRRIWEAEGEIRDEEGTLYARGRGRFIPMTDDQSREVLQYLLFDEETVKPEEICLIADS
jgi:uncharacterized protein (TIGR00369 family)